MFNKTSSNKNSWFSKRRVTPVTTHPTKSNTIHWSNTTRGTEMISRVADIFHERAVQQLRQSGQLAIMSPVAVDQFVKTSVTNDLTKLCEAIVAYRQRVACGEEDGDDSDSDTDAEDYDEEYAVEQDEITSAACSAALVSSAGTETDGKTLVTAFMAWKNGPLPSPIMSPRPSSEYTSVDGTTCVMDDLIIEDDCEELDLDVSFISQTKSEAAVTIHHQGRASRADDMGVPAYEIGANVASRSQSLPRRLPSYPEEPTPSPAFTTTRVPRVSWASPDMVTPSSPVSLAQKYGNRMRAGGAVSGPRDMPDHMRPRIEPRFVHGPRPMDPSMEARFDEIVRVVSMKPPRRSFFSRRPRVVADPVGAAAQ